MFVHFTCPKGILLLLLLLYEKVSTLLHTEKYNKIASHTMHDLCVMSANPLLKESLCAYSNDQVDECFYFSSKRNQYTVSQIKTNSADKVNNGSSNLRILDGL